MDMYKVDAEVLGGYRFTHDVCSQFGHGINKRMQVVVEGLDAHYEVWSKDEHVISTRNLQRAIAAYNAEGYSA